MTSTKKYWHNIKPFKLELNAHCPLQQNQGFNGHPILCMFPGDDLSGCLVCQNHAAHQLYSNFGANTLYCTSYHQYFSQENVINACKNL